MLLSPISIFEQPWMIAIMGLLMSVVLFVPVIVSVLYRLVFAMILVAVVALAGHAPLLALAITLGCLLASRTNLRKDMPLLAAALGLLPAGLYFYFFAESQNLLATTPLGRWLLKAPFLVAIVGAFIAQASVLGLARLTGYRPGIIWPVLVLLLAGPTSLFYTKVGSHELEYSLIASQEAAAPGDALFEKVMLDQWKKAHQAEGLNRQTEMNRIEGDLQIRQQELCASCEGFLRRHPASPRAPSILWVKAQTQSLEIHEPSLRFGVIAYDASHALDASRGAWAQLLAEYGTSNQAALALWRLGEFDLRDGNVGAAIAKLADARKRLEQIVADVASGRENESRKDSVFARPLGVPEAEYYPDALFKVRKLIWLAEENRVADDAQARDALAELLKADPNKECYAQQLGELGLRYENAPVGDAIRVALAVCTCDADKAPLLMSVARQPQSSAAIEANYELGLLSSRLADFPGRKKPADYFNLVLQAKPNPWQPLAREQLGLTRQ
jgi:hypothetical protein